MSQIGLPEIQDNLQVKIHCNAIERAVIMKAYITESISELFEIEVYLQTTKLLSIEKLINEQATISFEYDKGKFRYFSGIITAVSFENIPSTITNRINNILYIKIKPTLEKILHTNRYLTFLNLTPIELIQEILKKNNIINVALNVTSKGSLKKEFYSQYDESDFQFISRIMEEEGIFYYFEHLKDKDILHITDSSISSKKIPTELALVKASTNATLKISDAYNLSMKSSIGLKKVTSFSYNEKKSEIIFGKAEAPSDKLKIGQKEIFNRTFFEKSEADELSKTNLERDNTVIRSLKGESYCPEMYAGCIFKIDGSVNPDMNGEFFALEVKHIITQLAENGEEIPIYSNSFRSIPAQTPFRPRFSYKKPKMSGVFTAKVIGPEGKKIHCNDQGMVSVKFPWGDTGFVRVAQTWAGSGFGSVIIPRVGMEVLVTFVNGDPDNPIIIGCVYNGVNKPPVNYPLERNTVSSFYTSSIEGVGHNELLFDDASQQEQIALYAQKDLNYEVTNNVTEILREGSKSITLESNKGPIQHSLTIKEGEKKEKINKGDNILVLNKGNNKITLNEGNYQVIIDKGDHSITLSEGNQWINLKNGNLTLNIKGDLFVSANSMNFTAEGNISFSSKKVTSIEAGTSVSLKAGTSFAVDCASAGIDVKSSMSISALSVKMEAKTTLDITSLKASISATTLMEIKGTAGVTIGGAMINLG